ncbi:hypothetical protein WH47_08049 [Habropoda laboriosa]|uniref:Uncharacterized protein n=1 Tax=Habropoda laboriosa TaxID=597456 RepID=A0A0L7QPN3_9HYME|nr:hypothetical protein WH47_08049 [Habropoda laboriosa]
MKHGQNRNQRTRKLKYGKQICTIAIEKTSKFKVRVKCSMASQVYDRCERPGNFQTRIWKSDNSNDLTHVIQ